MTNWLDRRAKVGKIGEGLACCYLKRNGYKILARNYKTKIGEIDIVAHNGKAIVFVEVKTRRSELYGPPEESINAKKMHKLRLLAQLYITQKRLYRNEARFDIVSVLLDDRNNLKSIKLIKNAF